MNDNVEHLRLNKSCLTGAILVVIMPQRSLSSRRLRKLVSIAVSSDCSQSEIADYLHISRSTLRKYTSSFRNSLLTVSQLERLSDRDITHTLCGEKQTRARCDRYITLSLQFKHIHTRMQTEKISLLSIWSEYAKNDPVGYRYSSFCAHYRNWCNANNLKKHPKNSEFFSMVQQSDMHQLNTWKHSGKRNLWERATAIQAISGGDSFVNVCHKIERSHKTVKRWLKLYINQGLEPLKMPRTKSISQMSLQIIKEKEERLIKLIHEPPLLHKIKRSSWSLDTLALVYQRVHNASISKSTISEIFKKAGYKFKKAKKVLTSNDPEFRIKLAKIKQTLSQLRPDEKFFSIDEFGPFSVKLRGGRTLVASDEVRTIPQNQKSKGSLICTAALELSTNQVTHFYSSKKNTVEMVKLLMMLIQQYRSEKRIFISWDSASWHASKTLYKRVDEVNSEQYHRENMTPLVELRPLPTGAQFLNVIEAVFSGMSRAILHNSNYQSVDECKVAINTYMGDRNEYFVANPKRAGRKIWGEERVEAVFQEANNCKDANWR
jgi:transposase